MLSCALTSSRSFKVSVTRRLSASNAAEALALIEGGAEFDLLFTDVIMPGAMNGRQLADACEALHSVQVLFTSGYTENAIITTAGSTPASSCSTSPIANPI